MIAAERRLRERQQRIREIILAAKQVFERKGFASATMLDIANHSELSRRTLYQYFKSKDEVSLAVAADTFESLAESIAEVAGRPVPAIVRLRSVLEAYLSLHRQDPSSFQVILSLDEIARAAGKQHRLGKQCYEDITRIRDLVARLLREGAKDGTIRPVPDPKATAATLVTMVHGTLLCSISCSDILRGPLGLDPAAFIDGAFSILQRFLDAE